MKKLIQNLDSKNFRLTRFIKRKLRLRLSEKKISKKNRKKKYFSENTYFKKFLANKDLHFESTFKKREKRKRERK